MRERFAIIARKYGIELNATSRTVRGESEKAKKTREEVKKNVHDYAQEIKSTGSKADKDLASELEKMEHQYKPVKSAQQSILDKARERLRADREKQINI